MSVVGCLECGAVQEEAGIALARRDEQIESQREDIGLLERELRSKRAQIKRLKSEQDASLKNDPHYDVAVRVLEHWRLTCSPNARELTGKRLEHCLDRLRGRYTEAELRRACDGYALKPYVVQGRRTHDGPKDSWHADAELIFRTPQHVDAGLRVAERADDLRHALDPAGPSEAADGTDVALSPLGGAAVRLARFGFYVFPCKAREKVPATRNGLSDAKRDLDAITACWSEHPHLNIGVRTGAESGIVVVDVDGDEGWDSLHALEDEHGELPSTASVTTPRGGQHLYFVHPGSSVKNSVGLLGPSLDVRGDGGYVLAPPSVGPGGRAYVVDEQIAPVPMPDWLLEQITKRQSAVDTAVRSGEWTRLFEGVQAGRRNDVMTRYVGHLVFRGDSHNLAWSQANAMNLTYCKPPMDDREVEKIVLSIARSEARK